MLWKLNTHSQNFDEFDKFPLPQEHARETPRTSAIVLLNSVYFLTFIFFFITANLDLS